MRQRGISGGVLLNIARFASGEMRVGKRRRSERFVGRGGDKLDGALDALGVDVNGFVAADLGANVGGFTDCLLQRGAARVYAVDTAYGVLDWKLRQDARVVVMERTNALHVTLPEPVDRVVVDTGWTTMGRIVPRAISLLKAGGMGVALLKPQYEAGPSELKRGLVRPEYLEGIVTRVIRELEIEGIRVVQHVASAVRGSGGNQEFFLLIAPC